MKLWIVVYEHLDCDICDNEVRVLGVYDTKEKAYAVAVAGRDNYVHEANLNEATNKY